MGLLVLSHVYLNKYSTVDTCHLVLCNRHKEFRQPLSTSLLFQDLQYCAHLEGQMLTDKPSCYGSKYSTIIIMTRVLGSTYMGIICTVTVFEWLTWIVSIDKPP